MRGHAARLTRACAFGVMTIAAARAVPVRSARADDAQKIDTRSIRIDAPCIADVRVRIDAGLARGGRLLVTGGVAQLSVKDDVTTIAIPACGAAHMDLALAPASGLDIAPSRSTAYTLSGTVHALSASLAGGTLDVDAVDAAHLGLSGTARVHMASLGQALQVSASGQSALVIDHAHGDAFAGQFLDHAQANVSDARLDAASLVTAQNASVTIMGQTQVATLTAHGNSVINVESVTGALLRRGDGSVRVSHYNGMIVDRRDAGLAVPDDKPAPPPEPPIPAPGGHP